MASRSRTQPRSRPRYDLILLVVVLGAVAILGAALASRQGETPAPSTESAAPQDHSFIGYHRTCIKNGYDDATCTRAASDGVNGTTSTFVPVKCPYANCSSIDGHNSGFPDSSNPAFNGIYNACMTATNGGAMYGCTLKAATGIVTADNTGTPDADNPAYAGYLQNCMSATKYLS